MRHFRFALNSAKQLTVGFVPGGAGFQELKSGYWLPFSGRLGLGLTPPQMRDLILGADLTSPAMDGSMPLYDVMIYSKAAWEHHQGGLEQSIRGYQRPAQPAFTRPALIVHETMVENPHTREDAGFTAFVGHLCLPDVDREVIRRPLLARPNATIGFVMAFGRKDFAFPQSRKVPRDTSFQPRSWVVEADQVSTSVYE